MIQKKHIYAYTWGVCASLYTHIHVSTPSVVTYEPLDIKKAFWKFKFNKILQPAFNFSRTLLESVICSGF